MEIVFWLSVTLIAYIYFGYPLLVIIRGLVWKRPFLRGDDLPSLSVIIVAHNEAAIIRRRIENVLALDYPSEKLEFIVASDGSDDGTNEIILEYKGHGVIPAIFPRVGKNRALNSAVALATNELLVFSDANSIFAQDALQKLASPFADPSVGGVAGNQTYAPEERESAATGFGEKLYWRFDQLLKHYQGLSGNVISATGAIYAIRRSLFQSIPTGVCDDAVVSYRVIAAGYRLVYEPNAIAYEEVAPSVDAEFTRKARVCVCGLQALTVEPSLFNPLRFGFYSVQLISHKLLRWLVFLPLTTAFLSNLLLVSSHPIYEVSFYLQLVFYGLALLTYVASFSGVSFTDVPTAFKALLIPLYFCTANMAAVVATCRFFLRPPVEVWKVDRS